MSSIGTVTSLWRYPVKSMMGEELRSTAVTEKGIFGDRAYALVDMETQKIVSAKNPGKWPNMFSFRSRYISTLKTKENLPAVRITLPNGSVVNSDETNVDAVISSELKRSVKLISIAPQAPQLEEYWSDIEELDNRDIVTDEDMPTGTFFDLANIHLLTVPTLNQLSELYPQGRFEVRRFRPNIVLNGKSGQSGFVENDWIGKTICIGEEVQLKINEPCPRCVMTTLPQSDLPKDTNILRTAAKHNNAKVGVYAEVIHGGTIKCDDEVNFSS